MECLKPYYVHKHDVTVPCGKCPFCMATRRSDWSTRLHYEAKMHMLRQFVTLTYADCHLTWKSGKSQLVKSDLQEFFKRVRKSGIKLRYYAVGEYGSRTYRPHYHILLFGNVPEATIRKCWDKGLTHVGNVTAASTLYCLKYMVNGKAKGMRDGRALPFVTMSRRPGLGFNYFASRAIVKGRKIQFVPKESMICWHKSERKNYAIMDGEKVHLPRYYKGKIFSKIDHVRIAVRDQRQAIESLRRKLYALSDSIKVSKVYPLGALSYHEEQLRRAAKRIREKSKQNLTI